MHKTRILLATVIATIIGFGSVLPGEVKKESFHFRQEGTVMYFLRLKENDYSDIMFGYVTNGMAGTGTLTISRNREITVEQKL